MIAYKPAFSIAYFIRLMRFLLPIIVLFYFLETKDWYWYILSLIVINIGILQLAYWRTSYIIDEAKQTLKIQSFIFRRLIPIQDIQSLQTIKSIENAPAFSSDRILINWVGGSIHIAPIKKAELIAHLKRINSAILLK